MNGKKEMKARMINIRDEVLAEMETAKTDECLYLLDVVIGYEPENASKKLKKEMAKMKARKAQLVSDYRRSIDIWFNSCILSGRLERCEDRYNSINRLGKKNIIELTKEIFLILI
jgi:hypothetical protein